MTDTPQQVPFRLLNRWTNAAVYETTTAADKAAAAVEAVAKKVDLREVDLSFVCFPYGASLVGARLVGARLDGARLDGASLDGASLDGARLVGASLVGARLDGARLVGARLVGASLDGEKGQVYKVVAGSRVAYAGPVGSAERPVFAFMVAAEGGKPFLLLRCGCFTGDEKAYRERVDQNYSRKTDPRNPMWLKQCLMALTFCKSMAMTWLIEKPAKAVKAKAAKA